MPGDLNGKEYGALLTKMDSVLGRIEDMGKKLDRVLDPEEGLYPQVKTLQTAAEQNLREHRVFWAVLRIIAVVVGALLVGDTAIQWIVRVL
jgi:hypothetical protein